MYCCQRISTQTEAMKNGVYEITTDTGSLYIQDYMVLSYVVFARFPQRELCEGASNFRNET